MKIVTVVGARPQFIKAAVLSRALKKNPIKEIIIHTGQHYDKNMSDIFFDELDILQPAYNLGIGGGTHGQNTGRMLENVESILHDEKPDYLLVYGDTDSTLAGALAAAKLHIPVAHVEAGLRSFNKKMPEEINRILTDHVSSLLFTPTSTATLNLTKENIAGKKVRQVGDVMYDAALYYATKAQQPKFFDKNINEFILSTLHRVENTDNPTHLENIILALNETAKTLPVVLPLHPRTRNLLSKINLDTSNIILIDPVSYLEMIWLLKHCKLVITDSGGLQKEAYFFNKSCVTTREQTEWVELVDTGSNILAGADRTRILSAINKLENQGFTKEQGLYGDGNSGIKIVEYLEKFS